jgi:hypothetical protein
MHRFKEGDRSYYRIVSVEDMENLKAKYAADCA